MKRVKYQNLHQLTIMAKLFPVNCYIYEEEDQLTLIDAGLSASYKGIIQTINELKKPLTNIVLTHGHGDHVGALDQLKETFPDAIVSISKRDSRLLKGDKSLDDYEPQLPIKGGVPKGVKTVPERLLKEGDCIGSLRVYETPGHTPGSISLLDLKNNAIIAGDAMQTRGKIAVSGQLNWSFPFPALATWNKEAAISSAKRILELKPSLLAVGHGYALVNPANEIEKAIEVAEQYK